MNGIIILIVMLSVFLVFAYKIEKVSKEAEKSREAHRKFLMRLNKYMDNRKRY